MKIYRNALFWSEWHAEIRSIKQILVHLMILIIPIILYTVKQNFFTCIYYMQGAVLFLSLYRVTGIFTNINTLLSMPVTIRKLAIVKSVYVLSKSSTYMVVNLIMIIILHTTRIVHTELDIYRCIYLSVLGITGCVFWFALGLFMLSHLGKKAYYLALLLSVVCFGYTKTFLKTNVYVHGFLILAGYLGGLCLLDLWYRRISDEKIIQIWS